jgi:hypothetical protein
MLGDGRPLVVEPLWVGALSPSVLGETGKGQWGLGLGGGGNRGSNDLLVTGDGFQGPAQPSPGPGSVGRLGREAG